MSLICCHSYNVLYLDRVIFYDEYFAVTAMAQWWSAAVLILYFHGQSMSSNRQTITENVAAVLITPIYFVFIFKTIKLHCKFDDVVLYNAGIDLYDEW